MLLQGKMFINIGSVPLVFLLVGSLFLVTLLIGCDKGDDQTDSSNRRSGSQDSSVQPKVQQQDSATGTTGVGTREEFLTLYYRCRDMMIRGDDEVVALLADGKGGERFVRLDRQAMSDDLREDLQKTAQMFTKAKNAEDRGEISWGAIEKPRDDYVVIPPVPASRDGDSRPPDSRCLRFVRMEETWYFVPPGW